MNEREPYLVFDIVRSIGHGGQADVFLVRLRPTGAVYACKFLREAWDPISREQFRREAARQVRVRGNYVVPVIASNFEAEKPFVILEYMPNGSLADELKQRGAVALTHALTTTRQIAVALAELHARGVVHRDLKPGNVLRATDGRLMLNDLGHAATMTSTDFVRAAGFVGTLAYAAPEQQFGLASPKSDVFALGVILYELVMGYPSPRGVPPSQAHGHVARCIDALLLRLTATDERKRPTAAEAISLIDDAIGWFSRVQAAPALPFLVTPRPSAPGTRASDGDDGFWKLVGGLALVGAAAMLSGGRSTWDPFVGRYRGPDGRFKSG